MFFKIIFLFCTCFYDHHSHLQIDDHADVAMRSIVNNMQHKIEFKIMLLFHIQLRVFSHCDDDPTYFQKQDDRSCCCYFFYVNALVVYIYIRRRTMDRLIPPFWDRLCGSICDHILPTLWKQCCPEQRKFVMICGKFSYY